MKKTPFQKAGIMLSLTVFLASCAPQEAKKTEVAEETPEISYNTDDPKSMIKAIEMSCGSWNKLWEQKDVEFTYSYLYPQEGKEDLSTERYVFDTEQSWAEYSKHEINVMPEKEGVVKQYYDGKKAFCKHQDQMMEDEASVGLSQFLRKANYHWFVMMFKWDNPGTIHEYQGQETVNEINYDKLLVTYDPAVTGKEQNDTYILYVNPESKMVDQFYFSLPAFGINDPVILMQLEYEEINGLKLATKRSIWMPGEEGYSEEPNLVQTSTNVKFNNGFTSETLTL